VVLSRGTGRVDFTTMIEQFEVHHTFSSLAVIDDLFAVILGIDPSLMLVKEVYFSDSRIGRSDQISALRQRFYLCRFEERGEDRRN
jgi:hypothetical protein